MRRKSTIAWCRTSAPRRTSEGRSCDSSSRPFLNQLTSPPAEKARPSPVTTRARKGARSASQAAATVISKISSGFIAFIASGRRRVRTPTSPSASIDMVLSSGTAGSVMPPPSARPRAPVVWLVGQSGREPTLSPVTETAKTRVERLDEQRRQLPDQPGVYVFRDRAGDALYVGKANSIRKRVASHFAGKGGGRGAGLGG